MLFLTACSSVTPASVENSKDYNALIPFRLRNNSLLPHTYTVIGYNPGGVGNWTEGLVLLPGASHRYRCPVGTKIYLADKKQVDIVMSGGNLRSDKPFLTVKASDAGKSFGLN